jgi:hypothetical protein
MACEHKGCAIAQTFADAQTKAEQEAEDKELDLENERDASTPQYSRADRERITRAWISDTFIPAMHAQSAHPSPDVAAKTWDEREDRPFPVARNWFRVNWPEQHKRKREEGRPRSADKLPSEVADKSP